jgi:hypothetical protein
MTTAFLNTNESNIVAFGAFFAWVNFRYKTGVKTIFVFPFPMLSCCDVSDS